MADVRLATYTDLDSEVQARIVADGAHTQSIEQLQDMEAALNVRLNEAEECEASLDTRLGGAEDAIESLERVAIETAVNTKDDLTTLVTEEKAYEGMAIYVLEDEKTYRYLGGSWVAENVGGIMFVDELPSAETIYNEYDVPRFTAIERCSVSIITDESEGGVFERIKSASNAGNKYGYAKFEMAGLEIADKIIFDIAVKVPNSRYLVGIGNMAMRPASSSKSTYDKTGCAIFFGTKDGTNFIVNGTNRSTANAAIGAWSDIHIEIDLKRKSLRYSISKNGTILYSGTEAFADTGINSISGMDAYTWTEATIDFGDITATALYGVKENIFYVIPKAEDCADMVLYKNDKPVKIGYADDITADSVSLTSESGNMQITADGIAAVIALMSDYTIEPVIDGVTEKISIKRYIPAAAYRIYAGDTPLSDSPLPLNTPTVSAAGVFEGNVVTARFYDGNNMESGRAQLITSAMLGTKVGKFYMITEEMPNEE